MTAAVEIYNKPRVAYREQTFALLLVNAWEILLKARVVQMYDNKLSAIQKRKQGSRLFMKKKSGRILTIGLLEAAGKAGAAKEIQINLEGLVEIRDEAAHLGELGSDLKKETLKLGSAAVRNLVVALNRWFDLQIEIPYLLPLGFLGHADVVRPANLRQKELLNYLRNLTSGQSSSNTCFAVSLHVEVRLNPEFSGGGSIGLTNDSTAPKVHLTDQQALERYPLTYQEVVKECRALIPGFKLGPAFHQAMKTVKSDANHAHERRLDPQKSGGTTKFFYARKAPDHIRRLFLANQAPDHGASIAPCSQSKLGSTIAAVPVKEPVAQ